MTVDLKITPHVGEGEFDPSDPYQAMCENFRRQVVQMCGDAYAITLYRDLPPDKRLGAVMAGVLTGLVGVCLLTLDKRGHDAVVQAIIDAIPMCRAQAEDIIASTEGP